MSVKLGILATLLCFLAVDAGSSLIRLRKKPASAAISHFLRRKTGNVPEFEGRGIDNYVWFGNFTVGKGTAELLIDTGSSFLYLNKGL